jgi:hypothetical protein
MPVVAVVAIGVVGPRARRISTEQELLATQAAVADQVIQALTLRLFSMFRE